MPYYAQNETADQDLLEQVLDEAARFVETELVPLNVVGDREGCVRHDDGEVTTPPASRRRTRSTATPAGPRWTPTPRSAVRACPT